MAEQLIIYQKVYDFVVWVYPVINRIPKGHRLVLGKQLEELCISLLVQIVKANKAKNMTRIELQLGISGDLDCLRILIRLTKDLRFMSVKQYIFAAEKVNEIGRIFTGWAKLAQPQQEKLI